MKIGNSSLLHMALAVLILISVTGAPVVAQDVAWSAVFTANGELIEGKISVFSVELGVDANSNFSALPPLPPEYTTSLSILSPAFAPIYGIDIRAFGETSYFWIFDIDPNGDRGPFTSGTTILSWDPSQFDPNGEYSLVEIGAGPAPGNVLIQDMTDSNTTLWTVSGTQNQNIGVVYTPGVVSCDPPIAEFTSDLTEVCFGNAVNFTDQSLHAESWEWDFGDGNMSPEQNPSHTYSALGVYTVSLTVTNSCGDENSVTKQSYITINSEPTADFSYQQMIGCQAALITFSNLSTDATSWQWDFGDGVRSTVQHPDHNYTAEGNYTVTLTASNSCGDNVTTQQVVIYFEPEPTAGFTADQTQVCEGSTVNFTDQSLNALSRTWDFGDGAVSSEVNPSHAYSSPGMYTVSLTVTNECGQNIETKDNYITVGAAPMIACPTEPITQFLCEPGQVCYPMALDMLEVNISYGTFDGTNLCFQADTAGTYDIQIDATNDCGTETCNISVVVEIGSEPVIACPDVPVEFSLEYAGEVCLPLEILGATTITIDGATYDAGTLCFQADTAGTYNFQIIAANNCGEDTCDISVIVDITPPCQACGSVVTPDGVGGFTALEGATVELWSIFPISNPHQAKTSDSNGAFAFDDLSIATYDLYAYAEGYYPGLVTGLGFGDEDILIVLNPLADLIPTSEWVDYYCQSNTLLGQPLPVGSVVEAFAQNILCGRQVIIQAGILSFMPVYRSSDIDDGATTGDIITFKVNGEEALAYGDVNYPHEYRQIEVCLEAGTELTKTCELIEGWNLVSWNIDTESDDIEEILMGHMDCIEVVLGFENGGLTYDPDLARFSTLLQMDHLSGYWIKVSNGCQITLEFDGSPVLASTPIPVTTGWNLVSYLANGPLAPIEALASIHDNLKIAYGAPDGIKTYEPGQDQFNTLLEMNSCLGYWVKVDTDGELIYPSTSPLATIPASNSTITNLARLVPTGVTPTTSWINLYSTELTVDGIKVKAGTEIAAYTLDDKKIGGFTVTTAGEFGFMPVYADDAGNQEISGMKPGEKFYLAIDGAETNETFTWTSTGARYEINQLTSKGTITSTVPDSYILSQNYPNPFNPTTSISFNVPASAHVNIKVFNALGQCVRVLLDESMPSGWHTVSWNGRQMNGQTASSGVYFYRLTSKDFSKTRKMMLLK